MQWSLTVTDLVSRLEQQERAAIHETAAELYAAQAAEVTLCSRLRGQGGAPVRIVLRGGLTVVGQVQEAVPAWALLTAGVRPPGADSAQILISGRAVTTVTGLTARSGPPVSAVEARLGLGHALRRVAAARGPVSVSLVDGTRHKGVVSGVGADHLDLRTPPVAEPDVPEAVLTLPFDALVAVAAVPVG